MDLGALPSRPSAKALAPLAKGSPLPPAPATDADGVRKPLAGVDTDIDLGMHGSGEFRERDRWRATEPSFATDADTTCRNLIQASTATFVWAAGAA